MSSFKDFLELEAKRQRAETTERDSVREEWIRAVDDLLALMIDWIKAADENGVLKIERTTHKIREPRIGTYEAAGLRLVSGLRAIDVVPVARYSIGSIVGDSLGTSIRHGRIDMSYGGRRFMLYRQTDGEGRLNWIIVDDQDYIGRPFEQGTFEHAIESLLG